MRPVRAAALVAVLLLAGCASGGDDPEVGTPSSTSTQAAAPTGTPSIPPGLLECGKPRDRTDLQLADVDLTTATWSLPSGFSETFSYIEDNPVETISSTWYAEPVDPPLPTLNVLNVIIYTGLNWGDLADDCGRVPIEAVQERLAQYREQINADPLSDATMTTVAGMPAIEQVIGLARYDYHGYWLFSQTRLLHVYCQWTAGNRDAIEAGCAPLVASVSVG
ncbi:MAG: hypothetical protein JJE50_00170 [Actinomycetales bacterium]|nr:hypothetical protein [Actinomycetales bacterium]